MEDLHEILVNLGNSSEQGDILATIIKVEGSAYKKEGASMLFKADGSQVGMLSAGCLEEDLAGRIEHFRLGEKAEVVVYDMRGYNQLSWGEGSGCNGVIHVLVEPVDEALKQSLAELKTYLDNGIAVTMMKEIPTETSDVVHCRFITYNNQRFGNWENDSLLFQQLQKMGGLPNQKGTLQLANGSRTVYVQHIKPKPRLIVIGAGKDAQPLVTFAARTGFSVIVADWRPALCNQRNFPEAEEHVVGFPNEIVSQIEFCSNDYVVILTHNFQRDKELLSLLINKTLRYLGVLGSTRRTKRLLDGREVPSHITSPIGLAIEAEGPEEIAISVVAELIRVSKQVKQREVSIRETI